MTGSLQVKRGKYCAMINIKDDFGKRKQKSVCLNIDAVAGNKRKAEKALREVLAEYETKHGKVLRSDILFCDYIKNWYYGAAGRLEQSTYESYYSTVNTHIYPYFHNTKTLLCDIEYQHLERYYNYKSQSMSANSLKKHHAIIKQVLRQAVQSKLIAVNPATEIRLPKSEKYKGSFLSIDQGCALLDASRGLPIEPVVILGMMYGLRRSEIAGLKWDAVDFTNETIVIQHTRTRVKTEITKNRTKNKSSNRVLPLNSEVKEYLISLRRQQLEDKKRLGREYQDNDYVCRWPSGRELKINYLSHAFTRLLKMNNLPIIRLHDLRHSCASYMIKMGCSMKEVSDWLGHSDISTSMNVYAHLDLETKKDVAERFKNIFPLKVLPEVLPASEE
jgi:Site-specific recombinase XerD